MAEAAALRQLLSLWLCMDAMLEPFLTALVSAERELDVTDCRQVMV
jgi:hypothetical protein